MSLLYFPEAARAHKGGGNPAKKEAGERTISELLEVSARSPADKCDIDTLACRIFAARRVRRRYFDSATFGEAAWDMLLLLHCAHVRGRSLTADVLFEAADVSKSVGLRWLNFLASQGLIRRSSGLDCDRSEMVRLTDSARANMHRYLKHIGESPENGEF